MTWKTPAALFFALVLAGCSGLKSSAPPPALYALHAAPANAAETGSAPLRIVSVAEPSVPPGFESAHVAVYLQAGRRVDYAAGAEWPAPLPKVLQAFIVQSAAGLPGVMAVTPDAGIPASYSLLVRVDDFEPVYADSIKAAPQLKIAMTFTLVSLERNKIATSFTLKDDGQAADNSLTAITSGLQSLAQNLLTQAFQNITREMHPKVGTGPSNARRR